MLPATRYSTSEWLIAGSVLGVNTNLTTYGVFAGESDPECLQHPFPWHYACLRRFLIMPQAQYSYTDNGFITAKLGLEKRIFQKGYINLSFEQNFGMTYVWES